MICRLFISVSNMPRTTTNLSAGMGDTDITARIALLCELAGEELVEFSAENTVSDKLSLFADSGGHFDAISLDAERDQYDCATIRVLGLPCSRLQVRRSHLNEISSLVLTVQLPRFSPECTWQSPISSSDFGSLSFLPPTSFSSHPLGKSLIACDVPSLYIHDECCFQPIGTS